MFSLVLSVLSVFFFPLALVVKVFNGLLGLPLKCARVLFGARTRNKEQDNDKDLPELEHFDATRYNVPINDLPFEIISSIFEALAHEDHACISRVSLVCQYWRAVALGSPIIWTFITLDPYRKCSSGTDLAIQLKRRAEHVRTLPILVDLDFERVKSLEDVLEVMRALHPHLVRCYSFRVVIPYIAWMAAIAEFCGNMRDNIESIKLQVNEDVNQNREARVSMFSGTFPRLRSVTLVRTPPSCIFPRARTPLLQKFHLLHGPRYWIDKALRMTIEECRSALTASSVLQDVCLECVDLHYNYWDSVRPIHMPAVKTLRLGSLTRDSAESFFLNAFLPSLVDIEIRIHPDDVGNCMSGISSAIRKGRVQRPRHLVVRDCTTTDGHFGGCMAAKTLAVVPWLTSLEIIGHPRRAFNASLFEELAWRCSNQPVLPNLRSLAISGCNADSGHSILRMVTERAKNRKVVRLQELRIVVCEALDPKVVMGLRTYLRDKLTILQSELECDQRE